MRRRMILFGVLVTLALTALSATSAAAAGSHRPDGWVRYEGFHDGYGGKNDPSPGAWKGKNVYNTTAHRQTATHTAIGASVSDKDYFYFTVTIQNDGGASDRIKVKGSRGAGVQYFKGSTNITPMVKAGTYKTARLAAGAKTTITVRIHWNGVWSASVTLTSAADSTKQDVVKAVRKDYCGC